MRARLPDRAVIAISGGDRVIFLQGLVSNDVTTSGPGCAIWSALLTPQGKWLSDFFIFSDATRLLLDLPHAHAAMIAARLSRFRLRADVQITQEPLAVIAGWGTDPKPDHALAADDPRLPNAGWRALVDASDETADATANDYDLHRLSLALPDPCDCEPERTLLLEANFDLLHGISWTKGCYMGQELTARTHYRGLVRRRLVPVTGADLPEAGAELFLGSKPCGTMRSSRAGHGLAFVRTEAWAETLTDARGQTLAVARPEWLVQREGAA